MIVWEVRSAHATCNCSKPQNSSDRRRQWLHADGTRGGAQDVAYKNLGLVVWCNEVNQHLFVHVDGDWRQFKDVASKKRSILTILQVSNSI